MQLEQFLRAHSNLWRDQNFYPWAHTAAALTTPILFYGEFGFDAESAIRFCLKGKKFSSENIDCFKNKKQLSDYIRQLNCQELHLKNLQNISLELLKGIPTFKKQMPAIRLFCSFTMSESNGSLLREISGALNGRSFYLQPMNKRRDDVYELIKFYSREQLTISLEGVVFLKTQRWPGDAKDFKEFVLLLDQAFVQNQRRALNLEQVKTNYQQAKPNEKRLLADGFNVAKIFEASKEIGFKNTARIMEALLLEHALNYCGGKKNLAARALQLSPSTLISRMQSLAHFIDLK